MAQKIKKSKQLAELVLQAEASRRELTQVYQKMRYASDVRNRVKDSLSREPVKWLGASILAGIGTSYFFRSRKENLAQATSPLKKNRGIVLSLLALLFSLSKPALKIYATNLLKEVLSKGILKRVQSL